jgi:hypothetical protein
MGVANSPLIDACENQTAADTLILTRRTHLAAAIALDDRLVTGGTTGAAAIDGFHGWTQAMEIEQGEGFSGTVSQSATTSQNLTMLRRVCDKLPQKVASSH